MIKEMIKKWVEDNVIKILQDEIRREMMLVNQYTKKYKESRYKSYLEELKIHKHAVKELKYCVIEIERRIKK